MDAAVLLDKTTFYPAVDLTPKGIKDIDRVPNLSPMNLAAKS
jgi:hypothetical protein